MRLDISTTAKPAAQQLLETAARADDLSGAQDLLLEVLRNASARQFATGAGWVRSDKAGQTLVVTGTLRDSLTRAGGNARVSATRDELVLESRVPYATYLAEGARGMPRRDPSSVETWRAERDAAEVLADYIAGKAL